MKLTVNKYLVVQKGTKKSINYYGFKTKKEALEMAEKWTKATGIEHEVIVNK